MRHMEKNQAFRFASTVYIPIRDSMDQSSHRHVEWQDNTYAATVPILLTVAASPRKG